MNDEEDGRDSQRRHQENNRNQAASSAGRAIVRAEIESSLRELGINLLDWKSIEEYRTTMAFVRNLESRAREAGFENRKNLIHIIWAAIAAGVTGAIGMLLSLKNGGH